MKPDDKKENVATADTLEGTTAGTSVQKMIIASHITQASLHFCKRSRAVRKIFMLPSIGLLQFSHQKREKELTIIPFLFFVTN